VNIIILEGDELLRERILAPSLRQSGFSVNAIGCAADLAGAVRKMTPDIVLLNIGLPDSDGFTVTRKLRHELPRAGIVMLTARAENADHVRGLSEGADAYLAKPLDIDVLIATLRSIGRRLSPAMNSAKDRNEWSIGTDGWVLISPAGKHVKLTKAERRVLELLMRYPNQVFSRDSLIDVLSDNSENFNPHRVDSLIHRLRKKVLEKAGEPLPLDAVHGAGYKLAKC
jgi:DNA-binding response OmpR family regulator